VRPGPLLHRLLLLVAATALLIPVAVWMEWVVLGEFAIVVVAAAAEVVVLQGVRLEVDRPRAIALALDELETTNVDLRSDAARPLRVIARQRWPEIVTSGASTIEGVCRPGEVLRIDMPLRAIARGMARVERLAVSMTVFGIMERIARAGETTELNVLPNLRAVKRLHKRLNAFALRCLGARAAPRIGKGREFDRLRDYVIDDDYRDIAWRATARHGRLIVREFRLDRSQDILICLDQGHRMAARVAQITRLDHAINASVLISYICNRMEDKAGIVAFETEVDRGVATGRGAAHLRAITEYVTQLDAGYRFTDYVNLATNLRRRLQHRTLILLLTVLPEKEERFGLLRAVETLAPHHLPLIVVLDDPNLAAAARFLPSNSEELSRTLVARELRMNRVELMRDLRMRGALVVESTPEDAGIDGVNAYIDVKRRQLL